MIYCVFTTLFNPLVYVSPPKVKYSEGLFHKHFVDIFDYIFAFFQQNVIKFNGVYVDKSARVLND